MFQAEICATLGREKQRTVGSCGPAIGLYPIGPVMLPDGFAADLTGSSVN
jgi:hypothetical protein